MSNSRNTYSNLVETPSLNHSDEEIEVPIANTHYPSIMEGNKQSSKCIAILRRIGLFFLTCFLLLTISLCFVYASKGHRGFYWLGTGLAILAFLSALKLHWMQSMDWDPKVRLVTLAQCAAIIFLCMGLMAVMYGPNLKESNRCSASTESFYIGGYITNLKYGGLQLATSAVQVNAYATSFTLGQRYPEGSAYYVQVITQPYQNDPAKPTQYCHVSNPTGTIPHANVTSIAVICDSSK